MAIQIVEIHPADAPDALNTEWFVVENRGQRPFNTRNCVLVRSHIGLAKKTALGTIDPGFTLGPGEMVRVITGHPGRKSHGKPPEDGVIGYNLFLNDPVLKTPGTVLSLSLRSLPVASAVYDPDSERGVAPKAAKAAKAGKAAKR